VNAVNVKARLKLLINREWDLEVDCLAMELRFRKKVEKFPDQRSCMRVADFNHFGLARFLLIFIINPVA
jgi:hypothetical protein